MIDIETVNTGINSTISTIGDQFLSFFSNVISIFTSIANIVTPKNGFCTLDEQLLKASDQVNAWLNFYSSLWNDYLLLNTTASLQYESFVRTKLLYPLANHKFVGYVINYLVKDADEAMVAFENTLAKRDKVQAGIVACEAESTHLVRLSEMIQEVGQALYQFRQAMNAEYPHITSPNRARLSDPRKEDQAKRQETREWKQEQPLEWLQRHIMENNGLRENWIKYVAPVDNPEGSFELVFDQQWCKQNSSRG